CLRTAPRCRSMTATALRACQPTCFRPSATTLALTRTSSRPPQARTFTPTGLAAAATFMRRPMMP
ncbi:hypothetical protein IW139_005615, partial [Coemansia sp. RSA 353]